jgi:hypothetical protein
VFAELVADIYVSCLNIHALFFDLIKNLVMDALLGLWGIPNQTVLRTCTRAWLLLQSRQGCNFWVDGGGAFRLFSRGLSCVLRMTCKAWRQSGKTVRACRLDENNLLQ